MAIEIRILVPDFSNLSFSLPAFSDGVQGLWAKSCSFQFPQNMTEGI